MKKLFLALAAGVILAACGSTDQNAVVDNNPAEVKKVVNPIFDSANFTTIHWVDSTFKNLGKVNEGTKVEVTYIFKNTGDKPLVISDASASCGCTVPNPPKEPIAPGQEGKITAEFNSQGRLGTNTKDIFVTANTKPSTHHTLKFQVEVEKNLK